MSATKNALDKVPVQCRKTLENLGFLAYTYKQQTEAKGERDIQEQRLFAYLRCLLDMELISLLDVQLIYEWLINGHTFCDE